jgi:hypothetical protein
MGSAVLPTETSAASPGWARTGISFMPDGFLVAFRRHHTDLPTLHLPEWPWVRQSAVFSGITIAGGLFEKRRHVVCFINIETGRLCRP